MKSLVLLIAATLLSLPLSAQEEREDTMERRDLRDSLIVSLQEQLQEQKLREIWMSEQLERTGRSVREDSMAKAQRIQRVDSLRKVTAGVPVVVDADTLFILYAQRGGVMPRKRAEEAARKIRAAGERLVWDTDSIYVFESELSSDVMCGEEVLVSLSDLDGLWMNTTRQELAHSFMTVAKQKIDALHTRYGMEAKTKAVALSTGIVLLQIILIWLTFLLMKRLRRRLLRAIHHGYTPLRAKRFRLLSPIQQGRALLTTSRWLQAMLILLQLFVSIPLIFSIFPETQDVTLRLLHYAWNPLRDLLKAIIAYLPKAVKVVVIFLVFYYFVKAMRFLADSIAKGRVRIKGFYADWAMPTFQILRALVYCFMVIVIWPLLPYSDSIIFQGVSVFLGVVLSLGSTTIIGNMLSGIIITYMRPFRIGDYIEVGGTMGTVIEKTSFVTRIKTSKNNIVTVPNSSILSSQTTNYTSAARKQGIIMHTEVTISYDTPREQVEQLLLTAAQESYGLMPSPPPFVLITALEECYVRYQLNAYTQRSHEQSRIYSELHKHIIDRFDEAGVEIMSPDYVASRNGDRQTKKTQTE